MAVDLQKIEKWKQKGKVAKLIKVLSEKNLDLRLAAIEALGSIEDNDAMNNLILALRDPNPSIRAAAADALGNMGNQRSIEFVRKLSVNDENEDVREKASRAFLKIKERVEEKEEQTV